MGHGFSLVCSVATFDIASCDMVSNVSLHPSLETKGPLYFALPLLYNSFRGGLICRVPFAAQYGSTYVLSSDA